MNIIELAKEAGIDVVQSLTTDETAIELLERFAALVRAEYEAPLKLAEEFLVNHFTAYSADKVKILAAIREALADSVVKEFLTTDDHIPDATKMVAEHKCGGCAKTAADGWALYCVECWEKAEPVKQDTPYCKSVPMCTKPCGDESCVEPVKQEPVAWIHKKELGYLPAVKNIGITEYKCNLGLVPEVDDVPLYAEPVDAKAIRAEALEEAAKVCEGLNSEYGEHPEWAFTCAAAIRGLK